MANLATNTVTKGYISSISFLDAREIYNKVVDKTQEQDSFLDDMELMQRMVPTTEPIWRNFENSELYAVETIKTSGVTDQSGGSGQGNVDIVLSNVAEGASHPRPGDLVLFPSGYIGYVYSKTNGAGGDTINVRALQATVTTALLNAADGDKLAFISNASGEGSTTPTLRRYPLTSIYNQAQKFKEAFSITDVQKASKVEVEYNGQPYTMYRQQAEHFLKFQADISNALLWGQISDSNWTESSSTLDDADGNAVQTTRGLRSYLTDYGINIPSATLNDSFFQTLARQLAARRVGKNQMVYGGVEAQIALNEYGAALNANAYSPNARLMANGRTVDIEVSQITVHGFTYNFRHCPQFNHQNLVNFTGSAGFEKDIYMIPMDRVRHHADGGMSDRLRVRYMYDNQHDHRYVETIHGRLAPMPNGENDEFKIIYSAIMGLEVLAPSHGVYVNLA